MLRTSLSTSTARGAVRYFQTSRPASRIPQTLTQRTFTTTRTTRSKPSFSSTSKSTNFTFSSHARPSPSSFINSTILQRLRSSLRFFHNSRARLNGKPISPNPTPNLGSPAAEAEPASLSARLRKLSREYGWSAVGVYLALSALDFPFCYLLVRYLGTDLIGEWEHSITSAIKRFIPDSVKQTWHEWRISMKKTEQSIEGSNDVSEHVEMAGWGVEEADRANKMDASLATQLALAYAIHKSFIFVRVPLTAAILPKVVKTLRGWGWDIGKRTTKEVRALNRAARQTKK